MDIAVVREILRKSYLKGAFQAFLLASSENGSPVDVMAEQLGVSRATMYRYLAKIRSNRKRDLRVETIQKPTANPEPCGHTGVFYLGRKRICLDCMLSNFEGDRFFAPTADDPKPDKVPCVPRELKGGVGKTKVGAA